jgi:cell division protein ZapA (FtsZ GTPase activity inhibitor)
MMYTKFNFAKITILIILSPYLGSCTYTTKKVKNPEFKIALAEVASNLKTLVSFEHVNINGTEISTNGKISSKLAVQILNGVNIPTDNVELKAFLRPIAHQFKQELKNQNDFNTFEIVFVTKSVDGAMARTDSRGAIFKAEEL